MAQERLSRLHDWEILDLDIRGETLVDRHGVPLGVVDDLIVDTALGEVVAVRLDRGGEYPLREIEQGRGALVLLRPPVPAAPPAPVTTRQAVVGSEARVTPRELEVERTEARRIPLREEELLVGKEMHEAGEVQIRKKVVAEHQVVDVPVRREEIVIERHPVPRRPADRPIGESETVAVPLRHEHASVAKRPVVTEEVTLRKRAVEEIERHSGEVRRETVDIHPTGDVSTRKEQDL